MQFEVTATDGAARRGRMIFERGGVDTPAFMPVGTCGTVKAMTPEELEALGAQMILGNTIHLMLRPGVEGLRRVTETGVEFRSPVDGAKVLLTPESSIEVQHALDSHVVMVFDECTPYPASRADADASMQLSLRWAARSRNAFDELKTSG